MNGATELVADFSSFKETSSLLFDTGKLWGTIYRPNSIVAGTVQVQSSLFGKKIKPSELTIILVGHLESFDAVTTGQRHKAMNAAPVPIPSALVPFIAGTNNVDNKLVGMMHLFKPIAVKATEISSKVGEFKVQLPNKYLPSHFQINSGWMQYMLTAVHFPSKTRSAPFKLKFAGRAPEVPRSLLPGKTSESIDDVTVTASINENSSAITFFSPSSATPQDLPFTLAFSGSSGKTKVKVETVVVYKPKFSGHPAHSHKLNEAKVEEFEVDPSISSAISVKTTLYASSKGTSGPVTIPYRNFVFDEPDFVPVYDPSCINPLFENTFAIQVTVTLVKSGKKCELNIPISVNYTVNGPE